VAARRARGSPNGCGALGVLLGFAEDDPRQTSRTPMQPSPNEPRQPALIILAAALAGGLALRVWIALTDDGIYWPDEIYQSLEPAHWLVFGYGILPWEFIEGARNWTFPALIAAVLKLCALVGLSSPREYLTIVRLVFVAIALGSGAGAFKLARAYGASLLASSVAATLFLLAPVAVYFSHRAMSETASGLAVVLGLSLALRPDASPRTGLLGASLLGFSTLLRLQSAVFCVGLVLVLVGRRRLRAALGAFAVLLVWALLFGALDRFTWGTWFHSALVYLRFNLVEGKAAQWGTAPFTYYATTLFRAMPLSTLCLATLVLVSAARARGLLLMVAAFFLLHSWTPHKELRFLLPALPLACALAGIGLEALAQRLPRAALVGGVVALLCAVAGAFTTRSLKFGDLGQYMDSRPLASAYDDFGPINRLLLVAHQEEGLCGLKVEAAYLWSTGGYSYLHRRVPLYPESGPPRNSGLFNYVITTSPGPGGTVRHDEGPFLLVRLWDGPCVEDPAYSRRLP
jgi:phosphatidylinositol glycan class B